MFDWLGGLVAGLGDAISSMFGTISDAVWDALLQWLYSLIYSGIADAFTSLNQMGSSIFSLNWVQAFIRFFVLLGWALYATGVVVAVFDVAVEWHTGRACIQGTALNVLKGFFAASLLGTLPVELYKLCVTLQNTFANDLIAVFVGINHFNLADLSMVVLQENFSVTNVMIQYGLYQLILMIAFAYCVIKIFFANIKRGGLLLVQIAVGSLYLFSLPRGYADGFNQWVKQVIALCLTAFLQTTLLFLGLMTFSTDSLMGLGIMLAANEIPRVAQQFGLDSSVRVNMTSAVHTTSTAVHMARTVISPS